MASNSTGVYTDEFTVSWTNPTDPRYGGVSVYWINPGVSTTDHYFIAHVPNPGTSLKVRLPAPNSVQSWEIVVIAYDVNNNQNSFDPGVTPIVSVSVGTAGGTFDLSNTIPASIGNGIQVISSQLALKLVSGGGVGTSGSGISLAGFVNVGSAETFEGVAVKSSGTLVGFIGSDGAGHNGIWGSAFWAGGSGPSNAPLYVDGSGNLHLDATLGGGSVTIVGGTLTLNSNGITTDLNNLNDSILGVPVGVSVNDNTVTGRRVLVTARGITIFKGTSLQSFNVDCASGYGQLQLYNSSALQTILLNGSNGNVTLNGNLTAVSLTGDLWTGSSVAGAWAPGASATGYVPLYNSSGTLLGKVPYY